MESYELEKCRLFNLDFSPLNKTQAVERIMRSALGGGRYLVVTPNVDHVMLAKANPELVEVFNGARYQVVDGMPLVWMSRFLCREPLPERVAGSDLFVGLCEKACRVGARVYLLGAREAVLTKTVRHLERDFPGIQVVGAYSPPWGFEESEEENRRIVDGINQSDADIIFMAFGAPKQEKWAASHMEQFRKGVFIGVGGAFDMYSGEVKRAPVWLQRCGLEWFWRLCREPRRLWRRYILRDMRIIPWFFAEWWRVRRGR